MRIDVKYFAVIRERIGLSQETIEVPASATAGDVVSALCSKYPQIASATSQCRIAVNQSFAADDTPLNEGDEVVLIPPVAGGNAPYVSVQNTPLSIDRCMKQVMNQSFGGVCAFIGVVRNHNEGKGVVDLHYEAYREMAESVISSLAAAVGEEFAPCACAVEHRVGDLAVGDWAVVVVAATPHRAEAFSAARALIDRLKDDAPIWKKERRDDGTEWIGLGP